MKLGKYRHVIAIQVRTADSKHPTTGLPVKGGWATFAGCDRVPAEVLTGAGKGEMVDANAEKETIAARINFRWIPGITQSMRVVWEGQAFDIQTIDLDATGHIETRLGCTAGENNG